MITFMEFVEVAGTVDRSIVVQRVGPTPPQVSPDGGVSVWFWDSPDGISKQGELTVSYPVEQVQPLQREGNFMHVRLICAYNKVYATKLPFQVANNLQDQIEKANYDKALKSGPQQVGQARMNQARRVG